MFFTVCTVFLFGDYLNIKSKYLSGAFLLLISTVIVKVIGAVYKIPLTAYIGAVGRGYYSYAYNLCIPIHAITMGAFPIALSKLVSKYNAKNNIQMSFALKNTAKRIFALVGFVGMLVLILISKVYCDYIANCPKAIYTVIVLAPSILFSCMAASYRGYYEGNMSMLPTAVSQTIEALIKMIFGLLFAKLSMAYMLKEYSFDQNALSYIYPITSACSMLGVTFGTFVSWCFLWTYDLFNKSKCKIGDKKLAKKELFSLSFPIMFSTGIQSFFQFLETATTQLAIEKVPINIMKSSYQNSLSINSICDKDMSTYVYGLLSTAVDFKNLVPGVTMALGVCAVPAISRAFEIDDIKKCNSLVTSIFKYTSMLSSLGGLVLAFCSNEIMTLLYGNSSMDVVVGATDLVKAFAYTVPFYSLAGLSVFVLQAVGMPQKSIIAYIVSGIVRVVLNYILIINEKFLLIGAVISGAIGYLIMTIINVYIANKYAKIKLNFLWVFVLPVVAFVACFVLFNQVCIIIPSPQNIVLILLKKAIITALLYCILCFLCRMLNFRRFFRYFNE